MKRVIILLCVAVFGAFLVFPLSACIKKEKKQDDNIIGTWECIEDYEGYYGIVYAKGDYFKFNNDKTFSQRTKRGVEMQIGIWEYIESTNNYKISYGGYYHYLHFENDTLVLEKDNTLYKFSKV